MKLAGGGDLSEVDTAAFLEQAAEYESAGDLRESLIKLQMTVFMTHPLPVARAADLRRWIDSGAYARILAGDYPRRDTDRDASVSGDAKAAADSYRDAFSRSQDPLVGAAAQARRRRVRRGRRGRRRCHPGPRLDGQRATGARPAASGTRATRADIGDRPTSADEPRTAGGRRSTHTIAT